jgi:predicted ester cyclase
LRGPEGFKPFFRRFRDAFPDIQIVIEDCIAEGDKATARCTVKAKHTGEGLGVAATNNPIEFTGICIVRVQDGKIAEAWNNFDFLSLNQQIGVL